METARAVGDGKLTDDELGTMTRRVLEIIRRINEGSLDKRQTLKALQMLVEGRAEQMIEPCKLKHRSKHTPFKMLSPAERRKSHAPLRLRLEHSRKRLYYFYRAFFAPGKYMGKKRLHPEDIIALMWEAENIPVSHINHGWTPVQSILDDYHASKRDREIVATTLQWLGTNSGRVFLSKIVATADLDV